MAGAVEARVIDRNGQQFVVFPDGTEVPMARVQSAMTQQADYMPPPRADAAFTPTVPTTGSSYRFGDVGRDAGNEALQAVYPLLASAVNPQSRNLLDVATNYATGTAGGLLSGAIGLGQKAGGYAADVLGAGAEALGSDRWSRGGAAQALYGDMQAGSQAAGLGTEASALGLLSELGAGKYARGAIADRLSQPGPVPTMYSNPIAGLLGDAAPTRKTAAELRSEANIQRFGYDPNAGIMAYQGSPHNFPAERLVKMPDGSQQYIVGSPDKLPNIPEGAEVLKDYPMGRMRMDKIGTGEGAQAYGHGLYYAENSDVGRGYRDMGGFDQGTMKVGRQDIQDVYSQLENSAARLPAKQAEDKYNQMALIEDLMNGGDTLHIDQQFNNGAYDQKTYDWFKKNIEPKFQNSKKLYQVQINAKPEDFINFDAPFSEQPQKVQDFYSYLAKNKTGPSGDDLARRIESPIYAREAKDAGIVGVRYLDQGSRPTSGGEILGAEKTTDGWKAKVRVDNRGGAGFQTPTQQITTSKAFKTEAEAMDWARSKVAGGTQNYVVFDENLINIVKKYGIAGAAAMLGMSTIDVEKAMAGQSQQPPRQGLLATNPR